jgi:DNA polymerase III delta prime subunit
MHENIQQRLAYYHERKRIPNILFHGPHGSGKRYLVNQFVDLIYGADKALIKTYVIWVNCAHGKGIKYIRDNVKYFAKTNINLTDMFKTVVLMNADELTCDAQSVLRRCIEQFSFNTRFFMLTTDKFKMLKPILSRFSEIYVPLLTANKEWTRAETFKRLMAQKKDLLPLSEELYQQAFSALDLAKYVEASDMETQQKYAWLVYFAKVKKEFRNEQMLLYVMLYFYVFRTELAFNLFM